MNFIANLASSLLDEQEKFTDLTQVSVVDADACLDVLKKRFDNQKIYTHCGPLLVAVNPYSDIEGPLLRRGARAAPGADASGWHRATRVRNGSSRVPKDDGQRK